VYIALCSVPAKYYCVGLVNRLLTTTTTTTATEQQYCGVICCNLAANYMYADGLYTSHIADIKFNPSPILTTRGASADTTSFASKLAAVVSQSSQRCWRLHINSYAGRTSSMKDGTEINNWQLITKSMCAGVIDSSLAVSWEAVRSGPASCIDQ